MKPPKMARIVSRLSAVAIILMGLGVLLYGQFDQNAAAPKINVSSYPPEIQRDYRLFSERCSECHSVANTLKVSMSPRQWDYWVGQMKAMPSSHISNRDAKEVLAFLNYDEGHRKAEAKAKASSQERPAESQDPVALGRKFYYDQNCDLCHMLSGKGNAVGPALDDVGSRLTRDQLVKRMQGRRAGTVMPPLPPETTDQQINNLVEFLLTLKGKQ